MSESGEEEEKTQRDNLLEGIQDLWKKKELTDVTLVARGKEFPAHKLVLASSSTYFARLFLGGFREAGQARITIDYDPMLLDLVLRYFYGEEIYYLPEWRSLPPFAWGKILLYFGVKGYDPRSEIMGRFLPSTKEEANLIFKELTDFVSIYPGGIPQDVLDHLASLLIPQGTEPTPDLVDYSDEFITALLTSSGYRPKNVLQTYDLIKNLVEKGHSVDLLALINYNKLPSVTRAQLSPEFLALYNKGGPLPKLGRSITTGSPVLVVAEEPVLMATGIFSTKFIDDFGRTWNGTILPLPKLGDIISGGYVTMKQGANGPTISAPDGSPYQLLGIDENGVILRLVTNSQTTTETKFGLPEDISQNFIIVQGWTSNY